ncbi:TraB/GumN family protein [Solibacillus sp. MA9]|uniref:TraB/GumN family protein n=1 Tax=Solibacillus palustris TaxID=2908203 RepID=A0ABS9UE08_9BACL|nr:TraB/GumN family protein [Solibacillus sp. MA9]MCH7322564.1 TraB/GumN family protein [Solibacillus sp. MA9]
MNKLTKTAFATTIGASLLLTSVVPLVKAEQLMPSISDWAIETLNEGEKYGIFPLEWYYEDFQTAISQERLNTLLQLTEEKIASLELEKNAQFKPAVVKGNNTRGDIVNRLYNIAAQYNIGSGKDPVTDLQQRNVLRGSGTGLMLEEKATTQQAVIFAIRLIQNVYEQANAGAKGVAWVVADEDTTVYLLGSIHLGVPDMYPMHKKLTNAFNESQGLFVEANIVDPEGMEYYMEKAIYEEGKSIKDDISEEAYAKLQEVAELLEMPIEELETMKPWLITNNFSTLAMDGAFGLSVEEMAMHGIDMQFLLKAYLQQKPIYELEGVNAQVDMFDGLSKEAQEESLVGVLDSILEPVEQTDEDIALLSEWFMNWKVGDVDKFAKSLTEVEGDESEYNKMLFGKRDENMANSIVEVLKNEPGKFFVVVGAGHFLVDKNIRYHLEQAGYSVTPFYE